MASSPPPVSGLLLSVITIVFISNLYAVVSESAHKVDCNDPSSVTSNTISSLQRALNFFIRNEELLISDALLGVIVTKYSIEQIWEDQTVDKDVMTDRVVHDLKQIWRQSTRLLKGKKIKLVATEKFGKDDVSDTQYCMIEMIRCNVTKRCWDFASKPGYNGYLLTHQVLYFAMADLYGCLEEVMNFELTMTTNETLQDVTKRLCQSVFKENMQIQTYMTNLDVLDRSISQDLYLEQLAVCGINNMFSRNICDALNLVLKWQRSSGCLRSDARRRSKRTDFVLQDGCSEHKTAVAMGALGTILRATLS